MHEKYSDLLQQYVDREINPLEKVLLEEHLLSCRTCRQELNQFKLLDWELTNQQAIELPEELVVYRMTALKNHFAKVPDPQRNSMARSFWRLQSQILFHTSSFIVCNPVSHTVNRTVKRSFSLLAKVAGATIKKKNPLLARFIPGGT